MAAKGIPVAPNIRRNDIGVGNTVSNQSKRRQVVFRCVLWIYHQIHTILIYQIIKTLFHETNNDGDILHTDFMKLLNDSFNQRLPIYL